MRFKVFGQKFGHVPGTSQTPGESAQARASIQRPSRTSVGPSARRPSQGTSTSDLPPRRSLTPTLATARQAGMDSTPMEHPIEESSPIDSQGESKVKKARHGTIQEAAASNTGTADIKEFSSTLRKIHSTPLWIENTPQGRIGYFDDKNFLARMPERKFSILQIDGDLFEVKDLATEKSTIISRVDVEQNNWHLMRALDGFAISREPDPAMVAQWKVFNGEHDSNGQLLRPGIRVFHGTKKEEAWEHMKQHGITEDGNKTFGRQRGTYASSSYEVPLSYSGGSPKYGGRMARFIGAAGEELKDPSEQGSTLAYWPSEYNFSFKAAEKESVLPDDSKINEEMYALNHREMQKEIPNISRDQSDNTLRKILSRTDLRGFRKE